MTNLFVFYLIIQSLNGSQSVEVAKFESFEQCEHFLRTSYHRVRHDYPLKEFERVTGAGCKNSRNGQ